MSEGMPMHADGTHDFAAADLGSLLLDRCRALGASGAVLGPDGDIRSAVNLPRSLERLLRSASVQRLLMAEGGGGDFIEPSPGLRVMLLSYATGETGTAQLAAVALDPSANVGEAFVRLCHEADVDVLQARAEMAGLTRFDGHGASLMRASLLAGAHDLSLLRERDAALRGFSNQLGESYDTIDLLYAVGRAMQPPFDADRFLNFVCRGLHRAMSFRWVAAVFDSELQTASGLRRKVVTAGELPATPPRLRKAMLDVLRECDHFPAVVPYADDLSTPGSEQVLVHALTCKRRVVGALAAGGKFGDDPLVSSYDIQLVEAMGAYLNAFAENVALYEDQHTMFIGTVQALSAAIDAKDRYTFGHSERVAHLARELAGAFGMSHEAAERVYIAGLVHDVGKIGVPESVLLKPGRLTEEEFAIIKQHPEIGYRILKDIPLLADILPGVLHHHERVDGKGYPSGLKGNDIPLMARVLSVADTFDAMSSNRSYRSALSRDAVLKEIERVAGTQLDPEIASLVRHIDLTGFDALFNRHRDASASSLPKAA